MHAAAYGFGLCMLSLSVDQRQSRPAVQPPESRRRLPGSRQYPRWPWLPNLFYYTRASTLGGRDVIFRLQFTSTWLLCIKSYSMFISYVVSFFQYVFFVFIFHRESFLSPCYSLIPCIVSSIFPINLSLSVSVNILCYTLFFFILSSIFPSFLFVDCVIPCFIWSSSFHSFLYVLCIFNRFVLSFLILKSN